MPGSADGEAARYRAIYDIALSTVHANMSVKLRMTHPIDNCIYSIDMKAASREGFRRPHQPASSGKVVLVREDRDVAGTAIK